MLRTGSANRAAARRAEQKANTVTAGDAAGRTLPGCGSTEGEPIRHDVEAEPLIEPDSRVAPGDRKMQFVNAIRIQARDTLR